MGLINQHDWEDVSYHGSPIWQCRFCDCYKHVVEAELPCAKAESFLAAEAAEIERKERYEYEDLLRQDARREYLMRKFTPTNEES